MPIRSRAAAAAVHILTALCAAVGVVLQCGFFGGRLNLAALQYFTLMSNILFALDDPQDAAAFETSLTEEVDELLHVMRAFPCRWVLVSGETGLGGIRAERLARVFDDGLGLANQMLAAQAREAFLVVAGRCLRLEKLEF